MSAFERIAFYQNRRDEVPNQELACRLAESRDHKGIQEIAVGLWHQDPDVQSDCLKVLYEIGYITPELIAGYVPDFLKLLHNRNNRLVWGAMIALSTVASLRAAELYPRRVDIQRAMDGGSVITRDNGVKVLVAIAATDDEYRLAIFPYLMDHLRACRPKDVPLHAESILRVVDSTNAAEYVEVLEGRMDDLNGPQLTRVKKAIKAAKALSQGGPRPSP
jgi:hypothetical protein